MKRLLYNLLFTAAYAAMAPFFLLRMRRRGGYRARFADRFARYPEDVAAALADGPRTWIHAVSVGEVQVAGQLARALRELDPSLRFAFSTTSSTGWATALKEIGPQDVLIYNPLDFPRFVRRAFAAVKPRAVILTETEIWPNFLHEARRLGVPAFLANARISDRSAPRYRALRWFFGDAFRSFARIWTQSDLDAARLVAAGADPAAVVVTGSFKFDVARRNPAKERELRAWLGGSPDAAPPRVLLGASTWPGEDAFLLDVHRAARALAPGLRLVIAPRHFEKADAVEAAIRAAGFPCVRRSRGETGADAPPDAVFLADTTGELMGLFGLAEVAFVGKTLCASGGQNMIEPCLCGVATVVGPHVENFRPVMSDLLQAGAVVQAADAAEAKSALLRLVGSADERAALGGRARAAVERRRGATARCAAALLAACR